MTNIDQFESVFKAAVKTVFTYEKIEFKRVLNVTDLDEKGAKAFGDRVREFLMVLGSSEEHEWRDVHGGEYKTVGELLEVVKEAVPDLICTYRNLHSTAWKWPHSLGSHLDVITQVATMPVLVLPHPEAGRELEHALKNTDAVMAMTDHLVGDHRLVNTGVRFTQPNGSLFLTHIEDRNTFERYQDAISKIPSINTENAREEIIKKLLEEPGDYIRSCREALEKEKLPVKIEEVTTMGTRLEEYKRLIEGHKVDLLIMHTKDQDQLAMHGIAYPLAVELRKIPLLLI